MPFAKELRLFNLAEYFLNSFIGLYRQIFLTQHAQEKKLLKSQLALASLASIVSTATFIFVILEALAIHISIGDVTLYLSAVTTLQASSLSAIIALSNINEKIMFHGYYNKLMEAPQPLLLADHPKSIPNLAKGIEFRNIGFRYSERHGWVLRGLNLHIPAGQCTALVGLNGAGKSTLVKLLTRMYDPSEGQILWEGIDIREFEIESYRKMIGAVFQDFVRYDLTAQENIGLGNVLEIHNNAKIRQAAMQAGINATVEALPRGYDTILSRWLSTDDVGVELSGGQWQKIALARMFMRDCQLLILDEPTAALDAQSEYDLYNSFADLMMARTRAVCQVVCKIGEPIYPTLLPVLGSRRGGHSQALELDSSDHGIEHQQAATLVAEGSSHLV